MVRVSTNVARHKRVKRLLKAARGFRGARSKTIRSAKATLLRAGNYAYEHRRLRRRDLHSLWIVRINAAVRAEGLTYNRFMAGLKKADVTLDRKSLSELAARHPGTFRALVARVKEKLVA